jgi:hypothetical protein
VGQPAARSCMACGREKPRTDFAPYGKRCNDCIAAVLASSKCNICGRVAGLTTSGRPRKICDRPECQYQARVNASQKGHAKLRAKQGRRVSKICPACGVRKPLTSDHWSPATYHKDGSVRKWDGYCRSCKRAEVRDRYHSDKNVRAKALARAAKQRAAEWERRRSDPEYDALIRERRRQRSAKRRAEAAMRPRLIRLPGVDAKMPRVPVGPLIAAIDAYVNAHAPQFAGQVAKTDDTHATLCERIGVSDRTIRAWRSGGRTHANLDSADRLMIELDLLWWEVFDERWPADVVEEARQAFEGDYTSDSATTLADEEAA